jgi:hypothetical protein
MRTRTRRPKVQQSDLEITGPTPVLPSIPAWELDLIGPALEKLLRPQEDATTSKEANDGRKG